MVWIGISNSNPKFCLKICAKNKKAADTVQIGRSQFENVFKYSLLCSLYYTWNLQESCISEFDITRSFRPVHEIKACRYGCVRLSVCWWRNLNSRAVTPVFLMVFHGTPSFREVKCFTRKLNYSKNYSWNVIIINYNLNNFYFGAFQIRNIAYKWRD
jgi:hypothetical protein